MTDCIDRQSVKRAVLVLGVALLAVVGAAFSPRFTNSLLRVILPWASIEPYTETRIVANSITPKEAARFPEGSDVEVRVEVTGVVPSAARLLKTSRDGRQQTLAMIADARKPGTFRVDVPQADESFSLNDIKAHRLREQSLPVQDEIIRKLEELLARLQRNEQARKELKKLQKKDAAAHKEISEALGKLIGELDRQVDDQTQAIANLEKMPKKPVEEYTDEELQPLKQLDEQLSKFGKWAKGKVDELTKLPTGFVDDFGLRKDVNSVFEEIEKQSQRPQAQKMEVALEDLGISKATEMLEDLELWMPDAPDSVKWVQEEPLDKKPFDIPEMPLPSALEDLIGELMQEEDEFDQEADDVTSAWGDNLNQAGWGVSDGPISSFSAKGKTGNDLPNNQEVTGRSGDGRRGKSSGQAVGDTSRNLPGRKTPARLGNERYGPGRIKEEQPADPNGATGGGKKAGSGRRGLQGGTPPDFVRDMERLSEKQAGLREKAEQVAKQLETSNISGRRLNKAIDLMKQSETDLKNLRYGDASQKRKTALGQLRATMNGVDQATAIQLHRARELPKELRQELLQSADAGYPKGYESLLQNYFKALSEAEK